MKIKVTAAVGLAALAVLGSGLRSARKLHVATDELTVHEWGTFTSVAGTDGSAEEWGVLDGKGDLPGFVHNRGYQRLNSRLTGMPKMARPIVCRQT